MHTQPLLSIIVVSYNTRELTLQTLNSIEKEYKRSEYLQKKTELIVIDNNSTDKSAAAIKAVVQKYSIPTKIITNTKNYGFGIANNQGIKYSNGNYILLLNSDTIVQLGALEQLIIAFESVSNPELTAQLSSEQRTLDKLGIIAATLLNPDGTLQPQGGHEPTLYSLAAHMFFLDDLPLLGSFFRSTQHTGKNAPQKLVQNSHKNKNISLHPIDWVGGTAMCLNREMLNEIGTFDENIFMYGEDVELCMRAKKHSWDIVIHPLAKVIHLQNMSAGSDSAIVGEMMGYLYIWSMHKPLWQKDFAKLILELGCLFRLILFGTISKDLSRKAAYQKALQKLLAS
jgi:N-acetylglucosaminyl-diphospho-decaprenol L-rhamnosyltransferase